MIAAAYSATRVPLEPDFEHENWQRARPLNISRNWRGDPAPAALYTTARVLWTRDLLYFGFLCGYTELDVDTEYSLEEERYGLWDRDVCEAFICSPREPNEQTYKEFEVAPTGQWCDLQIDRIRMLHDWEWRSGMQTGHAIDEARHVWGAVMAIPFEAFGTRPRPGDQWSGNLYRISRFEGERQYLALSPTLTPIPDFHQPRVFVSLYFES